MTDSAYMTTYLITMVLTAIGFVAIFILCFMVLGITFPWGTAL